jgi:hypothetical protein
LNPDQSAELQCMNSNSSHPKIMLMFSPCIDHLCNGLSCSMLEAGTMEFRNAVICEISGSGGG